MVQFVEALLGLYVEPDADEDARQAGQGLIEYALMIWLIAIVVFISMVFLRDRITAAYNRIGNSIPN